MLLMQYVHSKRNLTSRNEESKKLGFASRQAFLFKDGILVWRDLAASTSKQAEDVLEFLNQSE